MATIKASTNEKVFSIAAFRGLNQNPDGDTKLKMGEAADVYNFRVTRDGNLQTRPGTKTLVDTETNKPIKGLWNGYVSGHEYILGACNGKLYKFWDETNEFGKTEIGSISTAGTVHIFGFGGIAYILNGTKYYSWDGTTLSEVTGYVPLVYISIPPTGTDDTSETIENVNRLIGTRRVWISPDGTGATFQLPEKNISSVDSVTLTSDGSTVSGWTANTTDGTVTFSPAPAQATNSIEITYTVNNQLRGDVEKMTFSELYAGTQDTRIFLYGDGTNKCIYSGVDYNGIPRADYFPDLYECRVGDENTPITGMIRHYSSLVCFKSNSSWMIQATQTMLANSMNIPAFYVTPANRSIGNAALGQVRLVLNSPFTLFGNDLYEWKNSNRYGSNLTSDERQAHRISDRVWDYLSDFSTEGCYCWDDNDNQEYYVCHGNEALVYNYAADAWSRYTKFPVSCMVNLHGELYIGSPDGKLKHVNYRWLSDDGDPIKAYWESGSMSFGQDYMRKYAAMLWIGIKPETNSEVYVTVQTDRSSQLTEKIVESYLSTFGQVNFARWSFGTNRKPHMKKLKIKAKKFVFYKLIFKCDSADTRATILAADIRVRFTGFTK